MAQRTTPPTVGTRPGVEPGFAPLLLTDSRTEHPAGFTYLERVRAWLRPDTRGVFAVSYVAQFEALESIGLFVPRERTRVLLRPVDGFSRVDAERLVERARTVPGLEVRQMKAGAESFIPHLKVLHFDHKTLGRAAILGSSNLTNAGLRHNLEVNALMTSDSGGFSELTDTLERLWSPEYSGEVRPSDFTESIYEKGRTPSAAHLIEFQARALDDLIDYYRRVGGKGGAMLSLPTGAGKTVIATRFLLETVLRRPGARVLWVAPQRELVQQAATTFAEQFGFRRLQQLRVEPPGAVPRKPEHGSLESRYNVIFRTLHAAHTVRRATITRPFDAIVVDEAHWGASSGRAMLPELLEELDVDFRLGLSATPFRTSASDQSFLAEFFAHRVAPSEDVEHAKDAAGNRILATVTPETVSTGVAIRFNPDKIAAYEDDSQALREIDKPVRNRLIARTWQPSRHANTLVFAYSIEHAENLAREFNRIHPEARVQVLHTEEIASDLRLVVPADERLSAEERAEVYRLFRAQEIDVLIAVNLYVAGVDFPGVNTLFMARPTLSPVLYMQMLGRGRRGPAFGGTETVHVVDFADQLETHGELRDRLMSLAIARDFGKVRAARERKWRAREVNIFARERLLQASKRHGMPAWFRVVKENELRRSLSLTKDLGAALERMIEADESVRRGHTVEFWDLSGEGNAAEVGILVREFSPDLEYRRSSSQPRETPRKTADSSAPRVSKKQAAARKKARVVRVPVGDLVNAFDFSFGSSAVVAKMRRRKRGR